MLVLLLSSASPTPSPPGQLGDGVKTGPGLIVLALLVLTLLFLRSRIGRR